MNIAIYGDNHLVVSYLEIGLILAAGFVLGVCIMGMIRDLMGR